MMTKAVSEFNPMRARRRPMRRQRVRIFLAFMRAMFFIAVFAALAYGFTLYLVESPRLLVQKVEVKGNHRLDTGIIQAATGVDGTTNLLLVKPAEVAKKVAALPEVRACRVRRDFPPKVLVEIEERVPVLTLIVNNHAFTVDRDGVVLRALGQFAEFEGPLVTDVPNVSAVEPGQRILEPAFQEVLKLWKAFRAVPAGQTLAVSEISAPNPDEIHMFCEDVPYALVWGRSNYEEQTKRFDYLWRQENGKLPCAFTLDLRFESDLVCR